MPTILDTLTIQTCVVSYGKEASFAGKLANVAITVTPKALGINQLRLVWAATGDIFSSFTDSTTGGSGAPGIIVLPQTGQTGFRHGTSTFQDWYYEAVVTANLDDGQQLSRTYRFQIPAGQTLLDLDMLDEDGIVTAMPAVAPIVPVTSVNGLTGDVTIAGGTGGATIDDTTTSSSKVWSSAQVAATYATLAQQLLGWGYAQSFRLVSATRDANEAITTGSVVWPDGATGTFTTDTASTSFPGAIDAYHVTHVLAGTTLTVTQTAVTRDAGGAVTAQPALTVA